MVECHHKKKIRMVCQYFSRGGGGDSSFPSLDTTCHCLSAIIGEKGSPVSLYIYISLWMAENINGDFLHYLIFLCTLFNTATSAALHIPPCRRLLGPNPGFDLRVKNYRQPDALTTLIDLIHRKMRSNMRRCLG
jgi:hypothetical protein